MSQNFILNNFFFKKKKMLKEIHKNFINSCTKDFQNNFNIKLKIRYLYTKKNINQENLEFFLFSDLYKKFYFQLSNKFCFLILPYKFIFLFFQYFYGNKIFFPYTLKNAMHFTNSENKIFYLLSRKILKNFYNNLKKYFDISMYDFLIDQKIDLNFFDFLKKKKYFFFYYELKCHDKKNIFKILIPEKILKCIGTRENINLNNIIYKNKQFCNKKLVKKIFCVNFYFVMQFEDFYISLYNFFLLKIGDFIEISAFKYVKVYINNFLLLLATWHQDYNFFILKVNKFFNFYYNEIFQKGQNMCIKNINTEELKENNNSNSLNENKDDKNYKSILKFNNFLKNQESLKGIDNISMNGKNILKGLERFFHIPIKITIELGHTQINMQELLNLDIGSIIKLDSEIHKSELNIYANDCLIAKGEIVTTNKKYGIRITKIVSV